MKSRINKKEFKLIIVKENDTVYGSDLTIMFKSFRPIKNVDNYENNIKK